MIGCILLGFLICLIVLVAFSFIFVAVCLCFVTAKPVAFGRSLKSKHVFITGGSKGIGKALAIEAVKRGASVTIVARDLRRLNEVALELQQLTSESDQVITVVSVDLSKNYLGISEKLSESLKNSPPVDILINNTGGSVDGAFDQLSIETFEMQMQLNYFSTVYVTKYFVEQMKAHAVKSREGCRIVFVSSQAGQLGVYGYSAYSPTKFALRGLAETLQMELKPFNIWVTVSYPPNTQTEGFAEEIQSMPEETRLISGTSGLMQPSEVAQKIMADCRIGRYSSHVGVDGFMLATLSCGMAPETRILDCFGQVFLNGLFRFVSFFYLKKFDEIVKNCAAKN